MRLFFINPPIITRYNEEFIKRGELRSSGPTPLPVLGIASLMAVAERLGHECKVLDLNVSPWVSEQEILDFSPDLLLLSSLTPQYRAARIIIDKMKGRIPIVLGGAHASIFKEKLLEDGTDVVAVGEGENTIVSLLKNFPENLDQVLGIFFKKNGYTVDTGETSWVGDLDTLPFPLWQHFDLDLYQNYYYGRKCLPVISSRGCPYHCVFCFKGVFGDRIRMRSAKNIFREITFLNGKYGIGAILFMDEIFTMRKSRVEEFCQLLIDEKTDIIWRCLSRVDQVDFGLLKLMKRAGCKSVAFGIESGNQEVINKIGKKIKLEQVIKVIDACNKIGIVSKGYYIIGLPWETPQTVKETIKFARKNKTTLRQFTLPVAYPGTELWNIGKRKGLPVENYVDSSLEASPAPYSFSEHLSVKQIEHYILKARNIGQPNSLLRLFKILRRTKLKDYPNLFKKLFVKISVFIKDRVVAVICDFF